jgi:vesicle coat complex subunit
MTYFGNKRGEIKELQNQLLQPRLESKMQALRQIIAAMTVGKDVSMLFMDVLKNMETNHLELKKLIYLYIINYAKTHPDLAILGINTFRKDAKEKSNPLMRSLAIRTMGCIRIQQMVEYLIDPLKDALKDEDSYVRKTAAVCVAKMHDINPTMMEDQGFIKILENLLTDGNAMVVSNSIAALTSISESKGINMVNLTSYNVQKLLTAINECNEWGQIYILDALVSYVPVDAKETENILERVSSRLSHSNAAVVMSTIKVIMKYVDYLTNPEVIRTSLRKLGAPLVSLCSTAEHEIQYVALRNINLILQKRPNILEKEIKIFFCNFNDPIYIKTEKLEILVKLSEMKNIDQILHELKEYANEIDIEFVRKAVRTIGRCAIKLEKASERCVQALWELLKGKVSYVVQEATIVIKDIFRKYPGKYEAILKDLCENLKLFEEPEAKAAIIWIIGEYVDTIENADQILDEYTKGFKDEAAIVQLQLLTSCVKLFLTRPGEAREMIMDLLKVATEECENPDLRDRAYIYWRLLAVDPALAKKIVISDKPPISDLSYTLETSLLDRLIENIGALASVYQKLPETFVKKLRESQNLREMEEAEVDSPADDNYVDSTGQKSGSYQGEAKNNDYERGLQNNEIDLLGTTIDEKQDKEAPSHGGNMMDILSMSSSPSGGNKSSKNIKIPLAGCLDQNAVSVEKKITGILVEAAIQKEGETMMLDMKITNKSNSSIGEFAVKFNKNPFKLSPVNPEIPIPTLAPGSSGQGRLELNFSGQIDPEPPGFPFKLQVALRTNLDIFMFFIPCSLSVIMVPTDAITIEKYQELSGKYSATRFQNSLNTSLDPEKVKEKFKNNNINFIASRKNPAGIEMVSYSCKLINGMDIILDTIYNTDQKVLQLSYAVPHASIDKLFFQAVGFIVNI